MFLIYGQESHPVRTEAGGGATGQASGEKKSRVSRNAFVLGDAHRSLAQRAEAARQCAARLRLSVPILLDTMDGQAARALGCRFGVTVLADQRGRVVYYQEGAHGIDPAGTKRVLKQLLQSD